MSRTAIRLIAYCARPVNGGRSAMATAWHQFFRRKKNLTQNTPSRLSLHAVSPLSPPTSTLAKQLCEVFLFFILLVGLGEPLWLGGKAWRFGVGAKAVVGLCG